MTNSEKNWTHISYKDKTRIPAAPSVRAGLIICCLSMLSAFSYLSWLHLQSGHLQQLYEYLNTRIYKFKCSTFISLKTEHGHISGLMYSTAVFYISEQRCQDPPRRDAVKMIREQTRLGEKCVCVCLPHILHWRNKDEFLCPWILTVMLNSSPESLQNKSFSVGSSAAARRLNYVRNDHTEVLFNYRMSFKLGHTTPCGVFRQYVSGV